MNYDGLIERTVSGLHGFLADHVSSYPRSTSILDVGCGTGAWLDRLASMGFADLTGIDSDPAQFSCRRAAFSKVDLDREATPLEGRSFGLITAIEVIEHLENPGRLWELVAGHLQEHGRFLLTTPNIQSLSCRIRFLLTGRLPFFDSKAEPTHIQPLYLDAAARTMARYGLGIERAWTYPACGSVVFRPGIIRLATAMRVFVADDMPGDIVCALIRRGAS